ncbi:MULTISPECIES: hypothetical protein [Ensifer]|uniref:hypothetical protein n=1 Tax=Ensifer TaxID=106591 RepID=UPI0015EC0BB5|nr:MULTISPECIES: hypothetical protein [Ensifer]MCY1745146.1 hypothetical protein [Ensifer sp. SL37]
MKLALNELAGSKQRTHLLGGQGFAVERSESAKPHQLRNTPGVLLVDLDRRCLEGGTHLACRDQLDERPAFTIPECSPSGRGTGSRRMLSIVSAELGDQRFGFAEDLRFPDDPAIRIHHTHAGVFPTTGPSNLQGRFPPITLL